MIFRNRTDAGRKLAAELVRLAPRDPVVLALPRGGVPVAFEIARALAAPLDLVLVRKVGAPGQPELAVGAVVDGERMDVVLNEEMARAFGLSETDVRERARREVEEIERRRALYLGQRPPHAVKGSTAIVVDDGIATGATVRAALRAVRRREPSRLILAVPVAPEEELEALRQEVDQALCLATPFPFGAVGRFYADFRQVSDDEVRELLARASGVSDASGSRDRS